MKLLSMNLYFICQIISLGIFFTFQTFTCKSSESLLIALQSFIIIFFRWPRDTNIWRFGMSLGHGGLKISQVIKLIKLFNVVYITQKQNYIQQLSHILSVILYPTKTSNYLCPHIDKDQKPEVQKCMTERDTKSFKILIFMYNKIDQNMNGINI